MLCRILGCVKNGMYIMDTKRCTHMAGDNFCHPLTIFVTYGTKICTSWWAHIGRKKSKGGSGHGKVNTRGISRKTRKTS